jgi:hypothetical protein
MAMALEGVGCTGPTHVIIQRRGEVQPARTGRYPKVPQFCIDVLRIASNQRTNVIGRKSLDFVLLAQPNRIEVWRFHAPILHPNTVGKEVLP